MDNRIVDDAKKELRRIILIPIILGVLVCSLIVAICLGKISLQDNQILAAFILFSFVLLFGVYIVLYEFTYKLIITDNHIKLKTLFKRIEIDLSNVEKYECKRYFKSEFYMFYLFINGKKVIISTRYKDEFETILSNNGIEKMKL